MFVEVSLIQEISPALKNSWLSHCDITTKTCKHQNSISKIFTRSLLLVFNIRKVHSLFYCLYLLTLNISYLNKSALFYLNRTQIWIIPWAFCHLNFDFSHIRNKCSHVFLIFCNFQRTTSATDTSFKEITGLSFWLLTEMPIDCIFQWFSWNSSEHLLLKSTSGQTLPKNRFAYICIN